MATFAEQMVEKYEAILLANAGVQTITVDGETVAYADLEAKYQHWKRAAGRESGAKPTASNFDLSKAFNG
jgi:hypothetical protein